MMKLTLAGGCLVTSVLAPLGTHKITEFREEYIFIKQQRKILFSQNYTYSILITIIKINGLQ